MRKAAFTYGLLDERLRALGFTVRTLKGKARIYKHEQTEASVILPDVPFVEEVIPHHLAVARHVLNEYNLRGIDERESV
jgi:predicted RNA binding protein YcfA (HicA-like mRNA interferase family)